MTRKRYIKLKMAEGLSRNEAAQNAREIVEEGTSYQENYNLDASLPRLTPEQVEALAPVFEALGEALINIGEVWTKARQKIKKEARW